MKSFAAVMVVVLAACGQSASVPARPPAALAAAAAPAFLANIPTDTPFVVLSLEALPRETLATIVDVVAPSFLERLDKKLQENPAMEGAAFFAALRRELGPHPTVKDLEDRGVSASARFAMYLVGKVMVFRLELRDDRAVLAMAQRIAATLGGTIPPPLKRGGREYWRAGSGSIAALAGNELVLASGKMEDIEAELEVVLGTKKPEHSYKTSDELASVMARHHLGGHLVAIVDTKRVIDYAVATKTPPPACAAKLVELSSIVPRIVMGHTRAGPHKFSGGVVVELSPAAVTELRALRTPVPGLDLILAGASVLSFGGGVDLPAARALAQRGQGAIAALAKACPSPALASAEAALSRVVATWVPAPFDSLTGFGLAVHDVAFHPGVKSLERLDGLAFVGSANAPQLFSILAMLAPGLGTLGIPFDGGIHAVAPGTVSGFDLYLGVGKQMIVAAIGAREAVIAERVIADKPGADSPLLQMAYDYGRFVDLQGALGLIEGEQPIERELAKVWGLTNVTLDVADDGLRFWTTMEIK